jgi:hypothetical protein
VPVADLGDRGHVDGVVEAAVPAPAQPVDLARAGGHLDRRGAVVGREAVPAGKAGHVADVADDGGGHDGPDSEQPGQAGAADDHEILWSGARRDQVIRLCREFCDVLRIVRCLGGLCRLRLVLGM